MLILLIFMVALFILFLLWLLPLKRRVLIEGIFEKEKLDHELFSGEAFRSFIFRDFCKEHVVEWRRTGKRPWMSLPLAPACYGDIHYHALNVGLVRPKTGDAVRLIIWQTIFGRVRLYYFRQSDFQWTNWHDEEDRQGAVKGGFPSVEEYTIAREKEWHEKFYAEAMAEHGLTREEAEELEPEISFVSSFGKEAKRCGTTRDEVWERHDDFIKNPDPEWVKYCENIFGDSDYYAKEFIEGGYSDKELKEHLNKCDLCNGLIVGAIVKETKCSAEEIRKDLELLTSREAWLQEGARRNGVTPEEFEKIYKERMVLRHGSADCFTAKERIVYARDGVLPDERLEHTKTCVGCERMIKADREEFLSGTKLTGVA